MDDDTIHNLDSAIAKADPTPQAFDAFRLADSALLHAHAPRLVGCELQDLGFLDAPIFQTNDNNESDLLLARGTRFRVLSAEAATSEAPMRLRLEILP